MVNPPARRHLGECAVGTSCGDGPNAEGLPWGTVGKHAWSLGSLPMAAVLGPQSMRLTLPLGREWAKARAKAYGVAAVGLPLDRKLSWSNDCVLGEARPKTKDRGCPLCCFSLLVIYCVYLRKLTEQLSSLVVYLSILAYIATSIDDIYTDIPHDITLPALLPVED